MKKLLLIAAATMTVASGATASDFSDDFRSTWGSTLATGHRLAARTTPLASPEQLYTARTLVHLYTYNESTRPAPDADELALRQEIEDILSGILPNAPARWIAPAIHNFMGTTPPNPLTSQLDTANATIASQDDLSYVKHCKSQQKM